MISYNNYYVYIYYNVSYYSFIIFIIFITFLYFSLLFSLSFCHFQGEFPNKRDQSIPKQHGPSATMCSDVFRTRLLPALHCSWTERWCRPHQHLECRNGRAQGERWQGMPRQGRCYNFLILILIRLGRRCLMNQSHRSNSCTVMMYVDVGWYMF